MFKRKQHNWQEVRYYILLAALSGLILGASFPPFQFGIISLVGFIPLLILFENLQSYKRLLKYSYISMFILNAISLYWIGGWSSEVDIFLILSCVVLLFIHPCFFVIPFFCQHYIRKNIGERAAIYSFPFIWVAFEYLHSLSELSFPWLILGNTQTYNLTKIQYITYTGVYGISFWIISINVLIYVLYSKIIKNIWEVNSWKSLAFTGIIILLFFIPDIISNFIIEDRPDQNKLVKVSILQPNINPWDKWQSHNQFDQVKLLLNMTESVCKEYKPDIVVWPETGIPYYIRQSMYKDQYQKIKDIVDSLHISLVTGFADLKVYSDEKSTPASSKKSKISGLRYNSYNSILHMQSGIDTLQIYHKMKLVPFSERIPYLDLYPSLLELLEWGVGISNWAIGEDSTIFQINKPAIQEVKSSANITPASISRNIKFWAMICYESIYPGFVSNFVGKGAQFLIIITNDSWFGNTSGPYQHNQYAILRAIENRRYVVRCANGGISSIIDPYGRILERTKFMTQTHLNGEIETRTDITYYSRNGDVFAISMIYISGLLIIISIFNKIKRKIKNG
jgi:apolipoprotein N-acyltransferase